MSTMGTGSPVPISFFGTGGRNGEESGLEAGEAYGGKSGKRYIPGDVSEGD